MIALTINNDHPPYRWIEEEREKMNLFTLDENHQPVRVLEPFMTHDERMEAINGWSQWYDKEENRRVGFERLSESPVVDISTVCLGSGLSYSGKYEAAVFIDGVFNNGFRCETWEEAEKLHLVLVEEFKKLLPNIGNKNGIPLYPENFSQMLRDRISS
ncbi:hypothetical protein ACN08P_23345 (plasmid) [Photobacterium leiognathi subsp. mandapamensis]|uniref:hypothetical protein n=1 Tax=Photobacterium leiognathi TaxID=553611 RepID=UPI003AF3EA3B